MRVQTLVCTILLAVSGCTEDRAERLEKAPVTRYDGGYEFNAVFSDLPEQVREDWEVIKGHAIDPATPIYINDERDSFSPDQLSIWPFDILAAHRTRVEAKRAREGQSSGNIESRQRSVIGTDLIDYSDREVVYVVGSAVRSTINRIISNQADRDAALQAIEDGVEAWSSSSSDDSYLHVVEFSSAPSGSPVDVAIGMDENSSQCTGRLAYAALPDNGLVVPVFRLCRTEFERTLRNRNFRGATDALYTIVAHETGHLLGLNHSEQNALGPLGNAVPHTPEFTTNSIMVSGAGVGTATDLTTTDRAGLTSMYPTLANTPPTPSAEARGSIRKGKQRYRLRLAAVGTDYWGGYDCELRWDNAAATLEKTYASSKWPVGTSNSPTFVLESDIELVASRKYCLTCWGRSLDLDNRSTASTQVCFGPTAPSVPVDPFRAGGGSTVR